MLPIETLKLMHRKTLKRLAAKNMQYRASWSDKIWDRKYDKKWTIKKHLFLIEQFIDFYQDYKTQCEYNNWSFKEMYDFFSIRAVFDMTVRPNVFKMDEKRNNIKDFLI
jgi:hypothetical protein